VTEIKTTSVAAEGGHWYTETGEQIQLVERASGDGMRKPTLRDARKHGWRPGVTTVIRQAAAPQLVRWQQTQAVTAALELDEQPDEDRQAYMRRVLHRAGDTAMEAARAGTEIHKAIELYFSGQNYDQFYRQHVLGVADVIEQACPSADSIHPWLAEQGVAHSSGFGTRVDLHSEQWVVDFKTKEGAVEDWAGTSGRITTYDNHAMQLAACRAALEERFGWRPGQQRCAICYVSRTHPGEAYLVEVDEDGLRRGWQMFTALLSYWKAMNRYDPTEVVK
jgi:hypothetical protein